jgi:hypothetical protein
MGWGTLQLNGLIKQFDNLSKIHLSIPGKLYAIGGSSGNSELKSGECFDPETRDWSKISDMSICRSNFDVCVLNGKLFAAGGTDGRHALESVEVFDPGGYPSNVASNTLPWVFSVKIIKHEKLDSKMMNSDWTFLILMLDEFLTLSQFPQTILTYIFQNLGFTHAKFQL